jgi:lycopene beta-cyclase
MSFDADLLILGGGCAGLSLGLRLADAVPTGRRTLILESRSTYTDDRTWCFWRLQPHRFEHLVRHQWQKLSVRSALRDVTVNCGSTPYQMLPSGPFYAEAQDRLAHADDVSLMLGTAVSDEPARIAGGWHVETATGRMTARQVIDTRAPHRPRAGDATLWQSVFGQEIECTTPCFDPSTAGLMDFTTDSEPGVGFRYLLPVSPTRALVESTVLAVQPRSPASLARMQAAAVAQYTNGSAFRVIREESGAIPMGVRRDVAECEPGFSRAGLMSGAVRPSSGYAFQRIQRWADASSMSLRNHQFDVSHNHDSIVTRTMDRVFLRVLRDSPERAPELFLRLFGDADPVRVIRFLSDCGSAADYMAVIAALPVGLFWNALFHDAGRHALLVRSTP